MSANRYRPQLKASACQLEKKEKKVSEKNGGSNVQGDSAIVSQMITEVKKKR